MPFKYACIHKGEPMTDTEAMDEIKEIMSGNEWSPDTLDSIAELVKETGREIEDS